MQPAEFLSTNRAHRRHLQGQRTGDRQSTQLVYGGQQALQHSPGRFPEESELPRPDHETPERGRKCHQHQEVHRRRLLGFHQGLRHDLDRGAHAQDLEARHRREYVSLDQRFPHKPDHPGQSRQLPLRSEEDGERNSSRKFDQPDPLPPHDQRHAGAIRGSLKCHLCR